jgi:hypothetical protein
MPVVVTPTKKTPSNRGSRLTMARYQVSSIDDMDDQVALLREPVWPFADLEAK